MNPKALRPPTTTPGTDNVAHGSQRFIVGRTVRFDSSCAPVSMRGPHCKQCATKRGPPCKQGATITTQHVLTFDSLSAVHTIRSWRWYLIVKETEKCARPCRAKAKLTANISQTRLTAMQCERPPPTTAKHKMKPPAIVAIFLEASVRAFAGGRI